jgi:hypothetical protein
MITTTVMTVIVITGARRATGTVSGKAIKMAAMDMARGFAAMAPTQIGNTNIRQTIGECALRGDWQHLARRTFLYHPH